VLLQLSAQLAKPPPPVRTSGDGVGDPRLPLSSTASPRSSEDESPSPCSPMLQPQPSRRISSSSSGGKQPGGVQPIVSKPETGHAWPYGQLGAAGLWQRMKLPRLLSGRGSSSSHGVGGTAEHGVISPGRSSDPGGHHAPCVAPLAGPASSGQVHPRQDSSNGGHTSEASVGRSPTAAPDGQPAAWVADDVAGPGSGCSSPQAVTHPAPVQTVLAAAGGAAAGGEQVGTISMQSSSNNGSSSSSSAPCVVAAPVPSPKQHSKGAAAASHVVSPGQLHTGVVCVAPGAAASSKRPAAAPAVKIDQLEQPPAQLPPSVAAAAADADAPTAAPEEQPQSGTALRHSSGSVLQQEQHQQQATGGAQAYKEGYAPRPGLVQARRNMFGSQVQKGL
jgi:hypothetical protein